MVVKFKKGNRIAQLLIQPVANAKIKEVKKISPTERGEGGFGASGKR